MSASPTPDEIRRVILLYGIWMPSFSMRPLAKRLAKQGFVPEILDYHSILAAPDVAVQRLLTALRRAGAAHLLGHSLGGLIALVALARARPEADEMIGRVLCLGSPLAGSAAARRLGQHWLTRSYMGRSATLLQTGQRPCVSSHQVGMLAGSRPLGLGQWVASFDGPHDGTVAVAETQVPGLTDHLVLPVSHNGLLWSEPVARQAAAFLRLGRFDAADRCLHSA